MHRLRLSTHLPVTVQFHPTAMHRSQLSTTGLTAEEPIWGPLKGYREAKPPAGLFLNPGNALVPLLHRPPPARNLHS